MENIFDSYSLTDDEFFKILEDEEIKKFLDLETSKAKELKKECKQYIINSLYRTLTRNNSKN